MKQVFISYSHIDVDWKDKFVKKFDAEDIPVWVDDKIPKGSHWENEIEARLADTRVAILLLSPNFAQSIFILEKELVILKKRMDHAGAKLAIFPVWIERIAEKTVLRKLPKWLAQIQQIPSDNHDLAAMGHKERRAEINKLIDDVESLISENRTESNNESHPEPPLRSRIPTLELSLQHVRHERYRLKFNYIDQYQADLNQSASYGITLYNELQCAHPKDRAEYGDILLKALFPDGVSKEYLRKIIERTREIKVRLRISVDHHTSRDLNSIHWETITGSQLDSDSPISSFLFSRYVFAAGDVSQKPELRTWPTKIMVKALAFDPPNMDDASQQQERTIESITALDNDRYQFSREQDIANFLKDDEAEYPIYLLTINNPSFDEQSDHVCFKSIDSKGKKRTVNGEQLAEKIRSFRIKPQLIIIQSTQPNHSDHHAHTSKPPLLSLAISLIDTGVCAVLTNQAAITDSDWQQFLSDFFAKLSKTGNLDRAIDMARGNMKETDARWKPVLLSRLKTGQIWYEPHLTQNDPNFWKRLCENILDKECIPVLGPEVCRYFANMRGEISKKLADHCQYPLEPNEARCLRKVTQFIETTDGRPAVQKDFDKILRKYAAERWGDVGDSTAIERDIAAQVWTSINKTQSDINNYSILARLEAPLYLTTSYHNVITLAINDYQRDVQERKDIQTRDRIFTRSGGIMFSEEDADDKTTKLNSDNPFIYYMFGRIDEPQSLVLTEDDHFTFLLRFSEHWKDLPSAVKNAFSKSSLLFLGFNLESWDFRALSRAFLIQGGENQFKEIPHVAVQIEPDDERILDPERTRDYLVKYFSKLTAYPHVYIGSVGDFLNKLEQELDKALAQRNQG